MRENWLMFRVYLMYHGGGLHFHYDGDLRVVCGCIMVLCRMSLISITGNPT